MVAVVPIPVQHELPVAHEIPDLQPEDVEEAPEHPEEEEPEEPVEDVEQDVVNALNEKANIEEMAEPASVQNVTLMEPVQSRHVDHLVAAMSKLHAKYRMLGSMSCGCTQTAKSLFFMPKCSGGASSASWSRR